MSDKKEQYAAWLKLPTVYFPKWAWFVAVKKQPEKYSNQLPIYKDQRVILT
jgi:hypothetical protein